MTLVVTQLLDGRFLVKGTDRVGTDNKAILESEPWAAVLQTQAYNKATKKFDKRTKKFFKPLTDAADEAKAAIAGPGNEYAEVVVTPAKEGKKGVKIELDAHGIVLNILAQGKGDLLEWVGDELVAIQ